jgi:hypothetical protein
LVLKEYGKGDSKPLINVTNKSPGFVQIYLIIGKVYFFSIDLINLIFFIAGRELMNTS